MMGKKSNRPQKGKSQDKSRRPTSKQSRPPLGRETPALGDDLKSYLQAAVREGDVTLEDAHARLFDLDGSTIGILIDDFYTGSDMLYEEVSEALEALIEQAGDQTPISDLLPDG